MKKYNLKLKKEFRRKTFKFDGVIYNKDDGSTEWHWLTDYKYEGFVFSYCKEVGEKAKLTQKEIDELPYGFVKMHDIIEVKEQLYYIRIPHLSSSENYLNERFDGEVFLSRKSNEHICKTKFTYDEINRKYPEYSNSYFMVKIEDDE